MGIRQPLPTGPRRPAPVPGTTTPIKNDGGKKYLPEDPNRFKRRGQIDYLRNSIEDLSRQDRLYKTY